MGQKTLFLYPQEMGFQNLLTLAFLPSKGIGERISKGILTEWAGKSTSKD
jgi:hypothetical protein